MNIADYRYRPRRRYNLALLRRWRRRRLAAVVRRPAGRPVNGGRRARRCGGGTSTEDVGGGSFEDGERLALDLAAGVGEPPSLLLLRRQLAHHCLYSLK